MRLLFLTILLFANFVSWADQPRYRTSFSSANRQFTIKLKQGTWFVQNKQGDTLYSLADSNYTSMTILVSNDGQRLVIIDDYPNWISSLSLALRFYNKSEQIKCYSFRELITSDCFTTRSVSHTMWTLSHFYLSEGNRFSMATYEFYEYEFDAEGFLIKKSRPQGYKSNSTIAYGDIVRIPGSKSTYLMKVKVYVAGPRFPKNELKFKANRLPKSEQQILMITDGVDVTPKRYRVNNIILNMCHEKESS